MNHFSHITSFGELKKQYRTLAITHHPDKGGDVKVMQEVNAEFDKLYKIWEHRKDESAGRSGYENDYNGATSKQYADYVHNEYKWVGSRYKGQSAREIIELVRQWLKETYPTYKFSARRIDYNSLYITLVHADFEPFIEAEKGRAYHSVNHYHIDNDKILTDRAKEVMKNIMSYTMSYNFDDSDVMTDYHHTNFYLTLYIGGSSKPYKVVIPELTCDKSKLAPVFKHPEGEMHKAIRKAMGKGVFKEHKYNSIGTVKVFGEISYNENGDEGFYPYSYGGYKTAQKRVEKLKAAGIKCHIAGYPYSKIVFEGYTPETEAALEKERQEEAAARKAWEENPKKEPATKPKKEPIEPISATGIELVDYSEKAFAIIGDTKPIKELLKSLGGTFNGHLNCGAGWIFSKNKLESVKQTLSIA